MSAYRRIAGAVKVTAEWLLILIGPGTGFDDLQCHSRSSKPIYQSTARICDFVPAVNSNLGHMFYRYRDIATKTLEITPVALTLRLIPGVWYLGYTRW